MLRFIIPIFLFLASCGPSAHFIGDEADFVGPNPTGSKKGLNYEKEASGDLVVYANAFHKKQGTIEGGYRVNLYFVNEGSKPIVISPELKLTSKNGISLKPLDYESFVGLSYGLQSATPPPMPEYRRNDRQISGTVYDQHGNRYRVNAISRERLSGGDQFAQGFNQGYAAGEAIIAMATIKIGRDLASWGEDYYIRQSYSLKPGEKTLATAYFRKVKEIKEDLELEVKLGNDLLKF